MKRRMLCVLLALLMVCALLPMGVFAADMSPYASLIVNQTKASDFGLLRDLNGDGVEELFLVVFDEYDCPIGQVYTLVNGQPKKLMEVPYTGPEITETSEVMDLEVMFKDGQGYVVKHHENYLGTDNPDYYWAEGTLTFYQLSNAELKKADELYYKLLMDENEDAFYPDESTITFNGNPASPDEMFDLFADVVDHTLDVYPIRQVYNATQGFFQDVPEDSYFFKPVDWALDNHITKGTSNLYFSPSASCTRGQVVTFLWRAANEQKVDIKNPFVDVPADAYYYDAVMWAYSEGITTGISSTVFGPDASCTRGQVVTFLWRAAGKPIVDIVNPFQDVPADAYYYDAVMWAYSEGITTGKTATAFSPDLICNRGEIVTFLYRSAKV